MFSFGWGGVITGLVIAVAVVILVAYATKKRRSSRR